jgi:hypothetical protein
MVNKIKTRGVRRNKYSKIKKYSKYRKHHTRKFRKRTQRRVRIISRSKKGGTFNLSLDHENKLNQELAKVLYKGFARVKKISNLFSFILDDSIRQVIICKLNGPNGPKWVILKCRDDEHCTDSVLNGKWSRPYKIYNMINLKEIYDNNGRTTNKFEYFTDIKGEHVYRIHLTKGDDNFDIEEGIKNLRTAIREQTQQKQNEEKAFLETQHPQYPQYPDYTNTNPYEGDERVIV